MSTLVPTQTSVFQGYIIDFTYTAFLVSLDTKVKLASFQENMLSHKTVFLSLCRSLWEDKLLYTLVPAARLFSRAACLAISLGTGVSKSCSRRVSFWDWGEYDDFSEVVGLVAAVRRSGRNYFRPYLSIFRVCHRGAAYQWNSPTILLQRPSVNFAALLFFLSGINRRCIFELNSIAWPKIALNGELNRLI